MFTLPVLLPDFAQSGQQQQSKINDDRIFQKKQEKSLDVGFFNPKETCSPSDQSLKTTSGLPPITLHYGMQHAQLEGGTQGIKWVVKNLIQCLRKRIWRSFEPQNKIKLIDELKEFQEQIIPEQIEIIDYLDISNIIMSSRQSVSVFLRVYLLLAFKDLDQESIKILYVKLQEIYKIKINQFDSIYQYMPIALSKNIKPYLRVHFVEELVAFLDRNGILYPSYFLKVCPNLFSPKYMEIMNLFNALFSTYKKDTIRTQKYLETIDIHFYNLIDFSYILDLRILEKVGLRIQEEIQSLPQKIYDYQDITQEVKYFVLASLLKLRELLKCNLLVIKLVFGQAMSQANYSALNPIEQGQLILSLTKKDLENKEFLKRSPKKQKISYGNQYAVEIVVKDLLKKLLPGFANHRLSNSVCYQNCHQKILFHDLQKLINWQQKNNTPKKSAILAKYGLIQKLKEYEFGWVTNFLLAIDGLSPSVLEELCSEMAQLFQESDPTETNKVSPSFALIAVNNKITPHLPLLFIREFKNFLRDFEIDINKITINFLASYHLPLVNFFNHYFSQTDKKMSYFQKKQRDVYFHALIGLDFYHSQKASPNVSRLTNLIAKIYNDQTWENKTKTSVLFELLKIIDQNNLEKAIKELFEFFDQNKILSELTFQKKFAVVFLALLGVDCCQFPDLILISDKIADLLKLDFFDFLQIVSLLDAEFRLSFLKLLSNEFERPLSILEKLSKLNCCPQLVDFIPLSKSQTVEFLATIKSNLF